jgi:hypothetical protein
MKNLLNDTRARVFLIGVASGLLVGIVCGMLWGSMPIWLEENPSVLSFADQIKSEYNTIRGGLFEKTNMDGIEVLTAKANISGAEIRLHVAQIEPEKVHVRIVSPLSIAKRIDGGVGEYSGLTLKEYAKLGKYKVVHSAGFLDTCVPPYPLGYVKIDGEELNRVHKSWLMTGVFCTNGKQYSISRFKNNAQFSAWHDCIQAGPLMIEGGKNVLDSSKHTSITDEPKEQSFVCVDKNKKLVLGITDSVALKDIVSLLGRSKEDGGLGCVDAVAMSAKYTAGMVIKENKGADYDEIGATSVPLPNAIVVE